MREPTFRDRLGFLIPLLGNRAWGSSGAPDEEERKRLAAAWVAFIDENEAAIDEGVAFDLEDERVVGLIPSTVDVR